MASQTNLTTESLRTHSPPPSEQGSPPKKAKSSAAATKRAISTPEKTTFFFPHSPDAASTPRPPSLLSTLNPLQPSSNSAAARVESLFASLNSPATARPAPSQFAFNSSATSRPSLLLRQSVLFGSPPQDLAPRRAVPDPTAFEIASAPRSACSDLGLFGSSSPQTPPRAVPNLSAFSTPATAPTVQQRILPLPSSSAFDDSPPRATPAPRRVAPSHLAFGSSTSATPAPRRVAPSQFGFDSPPRATPAPQRVVPSQFGFENTTHTSTAAAAKMDKEHQYDREIYECCSFYQRSIEINSRIERALEQKTPFHLNVTPLKLVVIDKIEELGRGQNSVAYKCKVRGQEEPMVLKLFKIETMKKDPKDALLKFALQLYHYTLYMKNQELKPFIAKFENLDYYVEGMQGFLAEHEPFDPDNSLHSNRLVAWVMDNIHCPAHLVEFVPNAFPEESIFSLEDPSWKQLRQLFQYSKDVPMDLSRSNVGITEEGRLKLFDIFEFPEDIPSSLVNTNLKTFLPTLYDELRTEF